MIGRTSTSVVLVDGHRFEIIHEADVSGEREENGRDGQGDSLLETNCIIEETDLRANDIKCFR